MNAVRPLAVIAMLCLAACQSSGSLPGTSSNVPLGTYSGGDGTSFQTAVLIEARSDFSATRTEYAWLREHVPGYKMIRQLLANDKKHIYDVLDVGLPDGIEKSYYFDIS